MKKTTKRVVALLLAAAVIIAALGCFWLPSAMQKKHEAAIVSRTLSNENATPKAQQLYRYLCSVYGHGILSGQQESTWIDGPDYEVNYLLETTGKLPAIRGFDFMGDDFDGVTERATAWAQRGGIVTVCWHCSCRFDGAYEECKEDALTAEQWEAVLTEGTAEQAAFLQAMDKAGNALLKLQDSGIPVLWRPFHEFDGGWFWWGKGGSDNFRKLWRLMYRHFTEDLGLNNLIWVLGYSHNGTDYHNKPSEWYPGEEFVDISGADSYEVAQNGAEKRLFTPINKATGKETPLALHETGLIPNEEELQEVPWLYFLTWHTEYLTDENSEEALNALYNSDYVITLDELPALQP